MKDLLFFSLIITRHWNKNIIKKYSSLFFFLFERHQKVLYLFSFISMIDVRATRNQFNSIGSKPFLQFQKRAVTTCQRQGTVAQMVEPATQNQKVLGSIPAWIQWDFASKYALYFYCIIFALKNLHKHEKSEKADFDKRLECAAPKCSWKYTAQSVKATSYTSLLNWSKCLHTHFWMYPQSYCFQSFLINPYPLSFPLW